MSPKPSRVVRNSARATTGVLILAAAAVVVAAVSTVPVPTVGHSPEPVSVDVRADTVHQVSCFGSFGVQGADADRASAVMPTGEVSRVVAGTPESEAVLAQEEPGGSAPVAYATSSAEGVAAAQRQDVDGFGVNGVTASACVTPVNEQWLVGGATNTGVTTTLVLTNPAATPATVRITVFDADGTVDTAQTSGVLVAPGAQRTVSLNGYAPGREQLAVRVVSTGAAVSAQMGIASVVNLAPFGADTVTRQISPQQELYVPGVINQSDHEHGPGDAGELDPYSVRIRVLAPGGETGSAVVSAVFADQPKQELATVSYRGGAVVDVPIERWPENALGVRITAPDSIVAGVLGSADHAGAHDESWFAPAPELPHDQETRIAVVPGGVTVVMNPQSTPLKLRVSDADGAARTFTVAADSAQLISGTGALSIAADAGFIAGVRVAADGQLASYPVVGLHERRDPLEIFTR